MNNPKNFPFAATLAVLTLSATTARGEELQTLPEITVTASPTTDVPTHSTTGTKTDTPLIEVPQSISVINRDQLDAIGAKNLTEALRYTPGIQIEPFGFDPRVDRFVIRGFDQSDSGLYRDGLQLPSLGDPDRSFRLETYGAERIEVLRGPASVLYGSGGPGGIVNYISKQPLSKPLYEVELDAGSFDRYEGKLDLTGPIDEEGVFSYRLSGLRRESDTQVDFIEDERFFIAPALTWRPSSRTVLTILGQYQDDHLGTLQFLPASGMVLDNPNGRIPVNRFIGEPDFDGQDSAQYSTGYLFDYRLNKVFTFRQQARYDDVEVDSAAVFGLGLDPDDPSQRTVLRSSFTSVNDAGVFSIDNQAQAKFTSGALAHTVLIGVDYKRIDFDAAEGFDIVPSIDLFNPVYGAPIAQPPLSRDENTVQQQFGFYIQEQLKVWDKLVLNLGGRYDRVKSEMENRLTDTESEQESEQDENEFTGRAGLVYLFDIGLAPYASYSESFLSTIGSNFFGEAFKPETGRQYEAGVKYQPTGVNSFITLAAFDLRRQNVLTTDPDNPLNDVQTGEIRSRGVEVEAVASLDIGLSLIAAYTYEDVEVTKSLAGDEGNRPTGVPEHLASLWGDYTIQGGPLGGLGFGAGVRYTGSTFANSENTFEVDDYTLVDAAIHYDCKGLSLAVNAQNLFDEYYVGSCSGESFCGLGSARAIIGSVRYRW